MWRVIAGVVVGFLVPVLFIPAVQAMMTATLPPDQLFQPGSYELTLTWILPCLAFALFTATVGGFLAALLGQRFSASVVVAVLLFVLLMGPAVARQFNPRPDPGPRVENVDRLTELKNSRPPMWMSFCMPVIVAAGGLLGGRLWKLLPAEPTPADLPG